MKLEPLGYLFLCSKLTGINVGGANGHYVRVDRCILKDFVGIAHRIEDGRIVIQIDHVAVDGQCAGQARISIILSLNDQNVVLNLCRWKGR